MVEITTCPTCGSSSITKVCRDYSREFEGRTYVVPDLEFFECPDCCERIFDRRAMRRIEAESPAFERRHMEKKFA